MPLSDDFKRDAVAQITERGLFSRLRRSAYAIQLIHWIPIVNIRHPLCNKVGAYEQGIAKLERKRLVLAERVTQSVPPKGRLEDCIEIALKFPSSH